VAALLAGRPFLVARNKADLGDHPENAAFAAGLDTPTSVVSALDGRGVAELLAALAGMVERQAGSDEDILMTGARHDAALRRADAALARAQGALEAGACVDMPAADLREALDALGEVTGERAGPDVLAKIFSEFCVGK
jgi:tRNA modification GTPase